MKKSMYIGLCLVSVALGVALGYLPNRKPEPDSITLSNTEPAEVTPSVRPSPTPEAVEVHAETTEPEPLRYMLQIYMDRLAVFEVKNGISELSYIIDADISSFRQEDLSKLRTGIVFNNKQLLTATLEDLLS